MIGAWMPRTRPSPAPTTAAPSSSATPPERPSSPARSSSSRAQASGSSHSSRSAPRRSPRASAAGSSACSPRVGLDTARSHPFEPGTVEEVDAATIEVLHATTGALLEVGTNLTMPGGPAKLLPRRFNRHTFWCGQSGSGKTYALGVVLEQIVAHTALPVVIFDPNSDFVRLGELNPGAAGPTAEALAQRDIRVLRAAARATPRCAPASST